MWALLVGILLVAACAPAAYRPTAVATSEGQASPVPTPIATLVGHTPSASQTPVAPPSPRPSIPPAVPAASPRPGGSAPPMGMNCPAGYPIKGNLSSSGEKIYHLPGSQFYTRTRPEVCFATEADAEAAGFRASKR